MRKMLRSIVLLGIVLALMVPVCSVMAKVIKEEGSPIKVLSTDLLQDPPEPEAEGMVVLVEPNGNVELIVNITASGLTPGGSYHVRVPKDGIYKDGAEKPIADLGVDLGVFTANANGQASHQWRATAEWLASPTGVQMGAGTFIWETGIVINESSDDDLVFEKFDISFGIE
ncbi:hypothetical protein ACFL3F_05080 [Planctomycetota bacterium]